MCYYPLLDHKTKIQHLIAVYSFAFLSRILRPIESYEFWLNFVLGGRHQTLLREFNYGLCRYNITASYVMLSFNCIGFVLKKNLIIQSNLCVKHCGLKMPYITRSFQCSTVKSAGLIGTQTVL
jgi:hypothetical protein